jgi:hypothetical protein
VPTKVTTVTKAPTKTAPVKAPAKTNPARELKVLKAFTVAWDDPDVLAKIAAAFDKHGKVAVTAQGDKAKDRKQQQRVQSIGYRRGFDKNLASAVTETHVVACPRNPDAPKSEVQAPATPRAAKEKAPAKTAAAKTTTKATTTKGEKSTPAKTGGTKTVRKATVKRTPAQAAYDRTFAAKDAEVKAQAEADQKAQADATAKLRALAEKEREAKEGGTTVADLVVVEDPTPEALAARDEHEAQVEKGVLDVGAALVNLDPPLEPEARLRIGVRGTEPVIETNYGVALGRPFKGRAVATDVLARVEVLRAEAATGA